CRPSPPTEYAKHGSIPWLRCRRGSRHGRLWRGSFATSPAAFQTRYRGWRERAHSLDHLNGAGLLWRISEARSAPWRPTEINGTQRIIHRRPSPANFPLPRGEGTLSAIAAKKKRPKLPAVSPPLARCVWEGMSNSVPVGSPRKSAAIILFVNKT